MTLLETARRIRCGDVTAEQVAQGVVERAAALSHLNAFTAFDADTLLERARAADRHRHRGRPLPSLHGVPIAVKDNIDVAGFATSAGTPALTGHVPSANAPPVQALLDHGALVAGKTNMHELAMGATSNNRHFGLCRNPFAPDRTAGGSSGGSAAAVAAGIVPASLGTDTIGSVRIPAALCGLVGFRPGSGRYPQTGVVPLSVTRDTVGPLACSVADVMLLDAICTGADPAATATLPGTAGPACRLGVPRRYFFSNMHAETAAAIDKALACLGDAGVTLVEVDIPELETFDTMKSLCIIFCEVLNGINDYLARAGAPITLDRLIEGIASPDVRELIRDLDREGERNLAEYRRQMEHGRPALQEAYARCFSSHGLDALVFPTTVQPAGLPADDGSLEIAPGECISQLVYLQNVDPGSYAGIPGISLPLGLNASALPLALGLDGAAGTDRRLLATAALVERLLSHPLCGDPS